MMQFGAHVCVFEYILNVYLESHSIIYSPISKTVFRDWLSIHVQIAKAGKIPQSHAQVDSDVWGGLEINGLHIVVENNRWDILVKWKWSEQWNTAGEHKYNREYEQKGGKTTPERLQGNCHSNNCFDVIFCWSCFLISSRLWNTFSSAS